MPPEEHGACALCGSRTRTLEYTLPVGRVVRCRCSLVSLIDPDRPELVQCEYDGSYYNTESSGADVGYTDYFGAERAFRSLVAATFARWLVTRFPAARTTLDVGCAGGYLVAALREHGIQARGIDSSRFALDHADPEIRPHLSYGNIENPGSIRLRPVDLVTLMDVAEHLTDPVGAISHAADLLNHSGALVMLTPRYGAAFSASSGPSYIHFNRDHVYYYSAETLTMLVEKATGHTPEIVSVLDVLTREVPSVPAAVHKKYSQERDSIIAVTRLP